MIRTYPSGWPEVPSTGSTGLRDSRCGTRSPKSAGIGNKNIDNYHFCGLGTPLCSSSMAQWSPERSHFRKMLSQLLCMHQVGFRGRSITDCPQGLKPQWGQKFQERSPLVLLNWSSGSRVSSRDFQIRAYQTDCLTTGSPDGASLFGAGFFVNMVNRTFRFLL